MEKSRVASPTLAHTTDAGGDASGRKGQGCGEERAGHDEVARGNQARNGPAGEEEGRGGGREREQSARKTPCRLEGLRCQPTNSAPSGCC